MITQYLNTVVNAECSEFLKTLPNDSVDLVVTSPPYDDIRTYNGYVFDHKPIAEQLFRILKPGGVVVWVVGDAIKDRSETGTSFQQALYFKSVGFNIHDTMIYEKNGASFPARKNGVRYTQIFEYMFVFSKGTPKTHNLICDKKNRWVGWAPWGSKATMRDKDGNLKKRKMNVTGEFSPRNNIWKYSTGSGYSYTDKFAKQHPAVFPEQLARDHILTWSNPGDVVLDPMCGSGTTLKMAYLEDRQYIGVDISIEYCDLTKNRIASLDKTKYKNKQLAETNEQLEKEQDETPVDFKLETTDGKVYEFKKIPTNKLDVILNDLEEWRYLKPSFKQEKKVTEYNEKVEQETVASSNQNGNK
jgi:DNA modification methylase